MKFQKSTGYAIQILHYLHNYTYKGTYKGDMATAQMISQSIGITYPFFIKIANQLRQKNLVSSVQGRYGGYQLGKSAHEISVYDVFLAVEGDLKIPHSLKAQGYQVGEDCALQEYYTEVREALVAKLAGKSIADFGVMGHQIVSPQSRGLLQTHPDRLFGDSSALQ